MLLIFAVGPKPAFGYFDDKPHSRNVTEDGPPAVINCKAVSIPNVNRTRWYINAKLLDRKLNQNLNIVYLIN